MSRAPSAPRLRLDPDFALARGRIALMSALGGSTAVLLPTRRTTLEATCRAAERAHCARRRRLQVLGYAGCALVRPGPARARDRDPAACAGHRPEQRAGPRGHWARRWACRAGSEEGVACMRHGMRISPQDRRLGFWGWALSHFLLRADQTEAALAEARASAGRDAAALAPHRRSGGAACAGPRSRGGRGAGRCTTSPPWAHAGRSGTLARAPSGASDRIVVEGGPRACKAAVKKMPLAAPHQPDGQASCRRT